MMIKEQCQARHLAKGLSGDLAAWTDEGGRRIGHAQQNDCKAFQGHEAAYSAAFCA
jgi:hypothetical protein